MPGAQGQPPHARPGVAAEAGGREGVVPSWRSREGAEVVGAYANLADLFTYSIPEDARRDFRTNVLLAHLVVASSRINSILGQRFRVPLEQWSPTVVWATCELALVGAIRQRGVNTEGDALNLRDREKTVLEWLEAARDHEVTPLPALSDKDEARAFCYVGDTSRGWDQIGRRSR